MGDSTPPFPHLQKDLDALSAVREQLEDYLATIERNTDAVNHWLTANRKKIILFHQRLDRAIYNKDEGKAAALIAQMGDVAGFVLSLQDFRAKAKTAFGPDNAFLQAASSLAERLPDALQEPLPKPVSSEDIALFLQKDMPLKAEEAKKWWGGAADWFNKKEKQREEQQRALLWRMRAVKNEILGLQSDRHYYIDGFMDWLADELAPETIDDPGATAAKMQQYKNPAYIIARAQGDYQEAVEKRANAIRDAALEYARIANGIDRQKIADVITNKLKDSPLGDQELQEILLEDYASDSVTEVIFKHIKSRADQSSLLKFYCTSLRAMTFSNAKTPGQIFEKFFQLALEKHEPLPPDALAIALKTLLLNAKVRPENLVFSNADSEKNIFSRTLDRFENDLPAQKLIFSALLTGMDGKAPGLASAFVDFNEALRLKNAAALLFALKHIPLSERDGIVSLWTLCHPGASLLDEVCSASSDPAAKGALLEQGIRAGIFGAIGVEKFQDLLEEAALPLSTIRHLLARPLPAENLKALRAALVSKGRLEKIVSSPMDDHKKTEWVAAFLEPFKSDIIRANILADAAQALPPGTAADALSRMEQDLIGDNIRLSSDKILSNLRHIANIWHVPDRKMLCYTMPGQRAQTLLENVSADMAEEILDLIGRRGAFLQEYGGIFKPENIDAIQYGQGKTLISCYPTEGPLNTDAVMLAQLQQRSDFLHVKNPHGEYVSSHNLANICLLQKMDDGTSLLIDKYGQGRILDGDIILPSNSPLLDLGGTVQFNPAHAAILRLNQQEQSLEFRIESAAFEKMLDPAGGLFFYRIEGLDTAACARLKKNLGQNDISGLYLNMKVLEYLALDDTTSCVSYKRYSQINRQGVVKVDPELAQSVLKEMGERPGIIKVDNILLHEDSIDNAYHDSRHENLYVLAGRDGLETHVSFSEGARILFHLAQNKKAAIVAHDHLLPTEIVNNSRSTLFSHNPVEKKTYVTTNSVRFSIALNGKEAMTFFDALENQGLNTAEGNIRSCLKKFPVLHIAAPATIDTSTPQALFNQVLGQPKALPRASAGLNHSAQPQFKIVNPKP